MDATGDNDRALRAIPVLRVFLVERDPALLRPSPSPARGCERATITPSPPSLFPRIRCSGCDDHAMLEDGRKTSSP